MSDDETFEQAGSGASLTVPVQAGALKKGDFVCINGFPCKVIELTTSKTGKHGHAKANITALDIFTAKKYEEVSPTSHTLPQPIVKTTAYSLLDIGADNRLSLMGDDGTTREDLNLPSNDELANQIKTYFEEGKQIQVVVTASMEREEILAWKEEK